MIRNFRGLVDVEDDAFTLRFERLLVAVNQRVAFEMAGEDEGGPFQLQGTALWTDGGYYVAADVPVRSTRGGRATIRFFRVLDEGESCAVEGDWSEDGYEGSPWTFCGDLDPMG